MGAADVIAEVDAQADPARAALLQGYFKTGPGEYGEGDVFAGLRVPQARAIAKQHRELPLAEIDRLLASPVHEHRLIALVVLAERSKRADLEQRRELCDFYLARTDRINNWDLVDLSCRDVVGEYLLRAGDWSALERLARSELLWERRIAMISTAAFIRAGDLQPTFAIAAMLLNDRHDLMHKAVGWMLREAGKKDPAALEDFLREHAATMPRTALRYSIERMTPEQREYWRNLK